MHRIMAVKTVLYISPTLTIHYININNDGFFHFVFYPTYAAWDVVSSPSAFLDRGTYASKEKADNLWY